MVVEGLTPGYAHYVYIDWTLDVVPEPFYVGEGNAKRVKHAYRNKYHDNIAKKHGFKRIVVETTVTKQQAQLRETELILQHRTHFYLHGRGANFKLRNTAPNGVTQSIESNLKRSRALKGKPKKPFTDEHRQHIKEASAGRKQSDETRRRRSVALKMKPFTEQHRIGLLRAWQRDSYRQSVSDAVTRAYDDPELRKYVGQLATEGKARKRFRRLAYLWFKQSLVLDR